MLGLEGIDCTAKPTFLWRLHLEVGVQGHVLPHETRHGSVSTKRNHLLLRVERRSLFVLGVGVLLEGRCVDL